MERATEDRRPEHERSPGTRSQDADGNFKYLGTIYCYYILSLAAMAGQVKARKWEAGSASDRCGGVYLYNNELGDVIYVGQTIQLPMQRDSQHYSQGQEIEESDLKELTDVCVSLAAVHVAEIYSPARFSARATLSLLGRSLPISVR